MGFGRDHTAARPLLLSEVGGAVDRGLDIVLVFGRVVLACLRPAGLLAAFFALQVFQTSTEEITPLEIAAATLLVAIACWWLAYLPLHGIGRAPGTPLGGGLIVFIACALASGLLAIAYGVPPATWARKLIPFLTYLLYFPLVGEMRDARKARWILLAVGCAILVQACLTIASYRVALQSVTRLWEIIAARRPQQEPVFLAGFASGVALLTGRLALPARLATCCITAAACGGLAVSFSRGYWIAAIVALAVVIGGLSPSRRRRVVTVIAFALAVSGALMPTLFGEWVSVVVEQLAARASSVSYLGQDASVRERVRETTTVLTLIRQNPIAGYGLGAEFVFESLIGRRMPTDYVHNAYLSIWYHMGALALGAYLYFYAHAIRRASRMARTASGGWQGLSLGLLAFLVALVPLSVSSPQFTQRNAIALITLSAAVLAAAPWERRDPGGPR